MQELSVEDGYARWSGIYDRGTNPLIKLEQECLSALLASSTPSNVLDAGTGTGRHAIRYALQGASAVGLDASAEMLAVAQRKQTELSLTNLNLVHASLNAPLPLPLASFDLAICSLALCHVENLELGIRHIANCVRPGGQIVISDLHPACIEAGLGTLFYDGSQFKGSTPKRTRWMPI